ncbi:tetratricopeptide repeat protein [Streptomyces montanus]|uniref:Tetratricopeptide repeat protein n=1 Tax=Streptomyces montanus TaxID=2580423 RepID=A0A5R9FQB9_9ACTN|nr:FxSxx-COOH system tetratricopeptide repeat protein [Streptomyces montanus]TLS44130.1 tetratricopeptide repeat protein [Streptomyces montanus]
MPDANPLDAPGPFVFFLATSENLGLSTTLRNVADILAEANRSVLLVDGRSGAHGASAPPRPEPGQVRTAAAPDVQALAALAADPVAAAYDHVLIEAPVPDGPETAEQVSTAAYADALVITFAMTAWSIDGAAALAEDMTLSRTGRPVRLLTLGLKSDIGVHDRLRQARERVRRKFAPLAQTLGGSDIPLLEIPYNPMYQDSRSLAVEAEDAGTVTGLRPYYERLADWLRTRRTARLTDVTVVHSMRHAPWAAWLRDRLAAKSVRTELRRADMYAGERPGRGAALLFLSPDDADDTLLTQIGALSHTDVRIVLVDEPFPHTEAAHHERIDLRGTTEDEALRLLYTGLGLGAVEPGDAGAGARFPRLPETTNVASRNSDFIDRDALLATLDEQLLAAGRDGACLVLHGPSGWGKSEAAHELCHRYGAGYDVVWWVRAWERERVERGLARLAGRLGIPEERLGTPDDDGLSRLLTRLSRPDDDTGSWLIVYDGVPDPAELRGLLPVPHEHGHVLITSRVPPHEETSAGPPAVPGARSPQLTPLAIPPMTPEEGRALLDEWAPEITELQAGQIGNVVDFVPHALHIAAHCLAERTAVHRRDDHLNPDAALRAAVGDLLAEYRGGKTELLRHTEAVSPVAVMVQVARRVVQATPGAAAWRAESPEHDALGWLLGAASLLTGRGMGLELLRSRRILSELARDDDAADQPPGDAQRHPDDVQLPDEHMVSVALWALARVGLLDVDFDRKEQPLAQHHGLRDLIRAGLEPDERRHIESVLRGILAEYAPQEHQDLPADWAREVYSLRLWEDTRPRVRRSLLRHLNALSQRAEAADLDRLLDIAGRAEQEWRVDGDEQSPEYLRLLNLTARAHRLRGDYDRSRRLAQDALRGHRRLLGITHPRTLLSADSYAATLRTLGRFEDALLELRPALEQLTLLLGWKHPATIQVEHNLALTEALTGRVGGALTRLQERFRYRQAVGGTDDVVAWNAADLLAYLYRAAGRDGEARDLLRQRLRRYGETWDVARLKTEVGLAVSERRLADGFPAVKDPRYGYELAHERDRRALSMYVSRFGPDRFDTLRCQLSYAADLHALGKADEAEQQARQCGDTLARRLGAGHPYTGVCQVRHGVYLRATGEVRLAEEVGRSAANLLTHKLGHAHPWVAAAENSLAATVAEAGRTDEAAELAHTALTRLRDLGVGHRPDGRRVDAHHERLTGTDTSRPTPPSGYDIDLELPEL